MEEEYQPNSVLLTGGAGFIPSHVLNYLVAKYPDVKFVCLDILDYCSNIKNIEQSLKCPNCFFVKGSILNSELVSYLMEVHKIDTVLHFAAQSHVDRSFGNSLEFTKTNVLGTHTLLECAKRYKIKRFIHVSTDEVYGEVLNGNADELAILSPTNPYACSKAGAEFVCQAYIRSFHMPIIITRGNNVFGPMQFPEKVIPKFIYRLREGKKCCIHGKGEILRNFLHTSDVVKAFDLILRRGKDQEIYNIGTEYEISINDLCRKIIRIMKMPGNEDDWIEHVEDRAFNDSRYMVNSSKLNKLGWKANTDFDTLLEETVKWYLDHPDYWDINYLQQYLEPHPSKINDF
ncbi:putative DTDP-glucose 4,6-dehydratase [Histomonas meleagridis]|uniref:putative DTDP-glucose 4,6-dehydratase n=1 Tax=Histomonas meleagridis TaxID=135588 RepID=UPI00355A424E|nr:putative DTDP-glucose 4,6-dehydratase [Histomonas meleagridis]KAH0806956.1 putative DTDP-glucose 4,6-dehydratase [Histomonas meleagridis]